MLGADLLRTLPPRTLPDVLVAEAERRVGGRNGLYVADIDGSCLLRLAGSEEFPASLPLSGSIGPEIPLDLVPAIREAFASHVGDATTLPLVVRDRAVALFVTTARDPQDLEPFLGEAALALEMAGGYSDVVHAARRRKPILPCAEVQQDLLPPRIMRMQGAELAGGVLPGYDVAGDVFDYADNADGTWIAVGDAMGKGNRAAAVSALAVGAIRAVRRNGGTLEETATTLDAVIGEAFGGESFLTALLAHWHAPTSTLGWLTCGHPPPVVVSARGEQRLLAGRPAYPLGTGLGCPELRRHDATLQHGDVVVFYSDGVSERRGRDSELFGVDGVAAAAKAALGSAAATVRAVQKAVLDASDAPLRDDATVVVLRLDV